MLTHPTLEKLRGMRLLGMANALQEQLELRHADELGFEDRLGLIVDRELTERENKRFASQLKKAQLRQRATLEDKVPRMGYRLPPSQGIG